MNKKGSFLQFVANAALVTAAIYFIFFAVFGAGGGFSAIYKAGQFFGDLPKWLLGVLALIFFYLLIGRKR